jgi:hypothetical protein
VRRKAWGKAGGRKGGSFQPALWLDGWLQEGRKEEEEDGWGEEEKEEEEGRDWEEERLPCASGTKRVK